MEHILDPGPEAQSAGEDVSNIG